MVLLTLNSQKPGGSPQSHSTSCKKTEAGILNTTLASHRHSSVKLQAESWATVGQSHRILPQCWTKEGTSERQKPPFLLPEKVTLISFSLTSVGALLVLCQLRSLLVVFILCTGLQKAFSLLGYQLGSPQKGRSLIFSRGAWIFAHLESFLLVGAAVNKALLTTPAL